MNKVLIITILFLFAIIFFLGVFVGVYKFFPYSELNNLKSQFEKNSNELDNSLLDPVDVDNMISIQNTNDLEEKRKELIQFIWKTNSIPKQLPDIIDRNISDERFTSIPNLKQIDKLTIEMNHGLSSVVYIFLPENSNGQTILYHQGHAGGFVNGKSSIQKFLENGFSVASFSMPLVGLNNQPTVELENIGPIKLLKHNQFVLLESEKFSSMSYFFTPLSVTLNYLSETHKMNDFHMVGISGGGWTTTVYPALDTRIIKSFSIAGSLPLSLRNVVEDVGDYEQFHPQFYSIANYFEIYLISSSGENRKHMQIFNKFDPCCFSIDSIDLLKNSMTTQMSKFESGTFDIIIDDTHNEHKISESIITLIINEISA